ncbi:hypothetical protein B0T26DRAFT_654006 [Lasiosphaeria miniovina]|uniref:Survival protein SurE-like phosphatase/nucleotidase domain-containing protein n=1 Tax=Lasiosphaeria miniovina TaxID=1954250 RepID=A0AA40A5E1_9PEZI|nr:uncharacterized protein B0T26DRAFT_654006 [Lasiosphaeria miniovina]KAK0709577.1 hypothetical protein B0T26DRAFT_654006 [Lasiosphaeria miniovina]
MHILVVNDDGPPSPHSSPYVHSLVRELQGAGHVVSVCLPHTQRSWIGKAHMIGQTVKPLYYRPPQPPLPAAGLTPVPGGAGGSSSNKKNSGDDDGDDDEGSHGTTHTRPSTRPGTEEWILVDGTPASCVQIGLYHFFQDRGPVDLVVSGPNYGRNTTAVFALSSGTLGGALEAAVCRRRAIALSYAFFTRNHDPVIIAAASRQSLRVIEALAAQWPADGSADLYSVNIPLLEGLEQGKVLYTAMLQNYWGPGSCFTEVDGSVNGGSEEEERIREGEGLDEEHEKDETAVRNGCHSHKHFKWSPRFTDVYRSVDEAPPGNDGWAVKEGHTSVTPLKANFWHPSTHLHGQELQFASISAPISSSQAAEAAAQSSEADAVAALPHRGTAASSPSPQLYALVDYGDDYVQPLILSELSALLARTKTSWQLLSPPSPSHGSPSLNTLLPHPDTDRVVQIGQYEALDFAFAAAHPATARLNSFVIRKALIRKHFLSATVDAWVAKHPASVLRTHVKRAEPFEVDYAEFLDDALVEAFDLRASLERNAARQQATGRSGSVSDGTEGESVAEQQQGEGVVTDGTGVGQVDDGPVEWWILKPSMSDRGQGIRLFSTMDELQGIFDAWEEDAGLSDSEDEDDEDGARDYITTSHLRHFVAQPYIDPPLLLPELGRRKFHVRVYVLVVGCMRVYVYRDMLALFAAKPYQSPNDHLLGSGEGDGIDLDAHLTNTCLQDETATDTVHRFWDLPLPHGGKPSTTSTTTSTIATDTNEVSLENIFAQICAVTGDVFEAAAREMVVHFQPQEHAFEVFGLDFLVDAAGAAWLLEVNAFPDFRQTGAGLSGVVAAFWRGVLRRAVLPFVVVDGTNEGGDDDDGGGDEDMILVRDVDLGRRWGGGGGGGSA